MFNTTLGVNSLFFGKCLLLREIGILTIKNAVERKISVFFISKKYKFEVFSHLSTMKHILKSTFDVSPFGSVYKFVYIGALKIGLN